MNLLTSRVGRAALATAVALLTAAAGALPAAADAQADEVAAQVDAQRAANGLGTLVRDPALDAAAQAWASHLTASAFEHSTNAWRQAQARPGWTLCCGENIAAGQANASAVMSSWMTSSGHRANILGGYSHLGVGHVYAPGTRYGHYWVQVFASYPFDRAPHEAWVRALYRDLLGRSGTDAEVRFWTDRLAAGSSRQWVASAFATSPEWVRSVVTGFYRDTLGREPDAAGLAYWTDVLRSGRPVAQVAAQFYGSAEYVQRAGGGSIEAWVRDLYRTLLGREADAGGVAYWSGTVAAGGSTGAVALPFYQSEESCRARVAELYRTLLGRDPDPVGLASWPAVVRAQGDLALAGFLVSSTEYFQRASH